MKNRIMSFNVDSLRFLYSNPFLILPYLASGVVSYYLHQWDTDDKALYDALTISYNLLIPSLITTYLIAVVYKKNGVYSFSTSVWSVVRKHYQSIFLISILGGLAALAVALPFFCILLAITGMPPSDFHISIFILVGAPFLGPVLLGSLILPSLWVMYYDVKILNAIKSGYQVLTKDFLFYYVLFLIAFVIGMLPLLFFSYFQNLYDLIQSIITSLFSAWLFVLFGLAFLHSREKAARQLQ